MVCDFAVKFAKIVNYFMRLPIFNWKDKCFTKKKINIFVLHS